MKHSGLSIFMKSYYSRIEIDPGIVTSYLFNISGLKAVASNWL